KQMKTGMAILVGALGLAVGIGSADAATRHHYRHYRHAATQQAMPAAQGTLTQAGNHPAKRYPKPQVHPNAGTPGTLMQNGNTPARRYATRKIAENAAQSGTLMQNGTNPAKRYKSTASTNGAAAR